MDQTDIDIADQFIDALADTTGWSAEDFSSSRRAVLAILGSTTAPVQEGGTSHPNVTSAMASIQYELDDARKDSKGQAGNQKYMYAALSSFLPSLRRLCGKHGCALVQTVDMERGGVSTKLIHPGGSELENFSPFASTSWRNAQAAGSERTYSRRYGYLELFGLTAVEDDDDGAAASEAPVQPRQQPARDRAIGNQAKWPEREQRLRKALAWYDEKEGESIIGHVTQWCIGIGRPKPHEMDDAQFNGLVSHLATVSGKDDILKFLAAN